MKIGITFSGGGARAAVHIGVIKALQENGIVADRIVGTSGGAIIAALYAADLSVDEMREFAAEGSLFSIFKAGLPIRGLTNLDYLDELLLRHIPHNSFEELNIPMAVAATNLTLGRKEFFSSGNLSQAVKASCAVPLIFSPILINEQVYADGGIYDNMPIVPLQTTCDFIIGINVSPAMPLEYRQPDSMYSIGTRVFDLMVCNNSRVNFPFCDVVVEPQGVMQYAMFNFGAAEEFIEIGYAAAVAQMPNILSTIENKRTLAAS